jgi:tRNA threonylcarbamoyladenosine biosynthesis protein TsaE
VRQAFRRISNSEAETALIGRALGAILRPGDILLIDGQLGAGKTTLIRSVATGMGLDASPVSSPTFVVAHEYARADGSPGLVHVDAYRLHSAEDLDGLGWDRLVRRDGPPVLVEWGERIAGAAPGAALLRIDHAAEGSREFVFDVPGEWASRPGFAGLAARAATVCPVTGEPVAAEAPHYPFASERAKLADLHRWFSGSYMVSRDATEADFGDE